MKTISDIQKEFQKKVKTLYKTSWALREDINAEDGEVVEFGQKTKRGDEIFTVTDWGNVWNFIQSSIQELLESVVPEHYTEQDMGRRLDQWDKGWNAAIKQMRENIERVGK